MGYVQHVTIQAKDIHHYHDQSNIIVLTFAVC